MNPKTQLVLIGVSGLFAILFELVDFSIGFYCTKPLTTLLILTLPLCFPHDQLKAYRKTVLWGLLFCLIGDSFLLFESFFLYGLTSFLVGHLCFLFAFVKQQGFQWPLVPGIFLSSIASTILFLCYDNLGALLLPVLVYIGVILIMSWQGIALQRQNKHFTFRYVGWAVGLFLFSDAVLALNKFYIPFAYSGVLILSTYWLAISLIALSVSKTTKEPV
ncbi:MAG: lysoplasmalogenase [Flavobacteriaceae bacterium]|nr:lysoplasmalogenase [Flavobacteriaceae bacterium]